MRRPDATRARRPERPGPPAAPPLWLYRHPARQLRVLVYVTRLILSGQQMELPHGWSKSRPTLVTHSTRSSNPRPPSLLERHPAPSPLAGPYQRSQLPRVLLQLPVSPEPGHPQVAHALQQQAEAPAAYHRRPAAQGALPALGSPKVPQTPLPCTRAVPSLLRAEPFPRASRAWRSFPSSVLVQVIQPLSLASRPTDEDFRPLIVELMKPFAMQIILILSGQKPWQK